MQWKVILQSWVIMFAINLVSGFFIGMLTNSPLSSLLIALITFAAGGYFVYSSVSNSKWLHVAISIVTYYLLMVLTVIIWIALVQVV